MAKITWPQSQLYERNSENGREYLCAGRVRPIQRWQVAQVIGNDLRYPLKGSPVPLWAKTCERLLSTPAAFTREGVAADGLGT